MEKCIVEWKVANGICPLIKAELRRAKCRRHTLSWYFCMPLLLTSLTESNRVVFAGGRHDLSRVQWFWLAEDGSRVSARDG